MDPMPDTQTSPGQVCYEACMQAATLEATPWSALDPAGQRWWEAAAQAVAPQALEACPRCGQPGPLTPVPPLWYDSRVCTPCAAELMERFDDDERTRGQEARYG